MTSSSSPSRSSRRPATSANAASRLSPSPDPSSFQARSLPPRRGKTVSSILRASKPRLHGPELAPVRSLVRTVWERWLPGLPGRGRRSWNSAPTRSARRAGRRRRRHSRKHCRRSEGRCRRRGLPHARVNLILTCLSILHYLTLCRDIRNAPCAHSLGGRKAPRAPCVLVQLRHNILLDPVVSSAGEELSVASSPCPARIAQLRVASSCLKLAVLVLKL